MSKIFSRRDIGYTIISRFEYAFRDYLSSQFLILFEDYLKGIPGGIIEKTFEKNGANPPFQDFMEFLDLTDFPDLLEISCFSGNYSKLFKKIPKDEFTSKMGILYTLRCKIAHVKGFFTSIDLDKLIELTLLLGGEFTDKTFIQFIYDLEKSPENFVIPVPLNFNIDFLENNGVVNNLPIPDYEYEGGFVGREEDIKKLISYLIGEKFPVISITGAGGVGKTSLALKVIQELTQKPSFNKYDAIIWLSAKENKLTHLGIEDIEPTVKSYNDFLDTIIEVLGFDKVENISEKEKAVNSIFEISKGILIVIDNLETISDERIINFIIDSPNNAKFLITSRKGLGQVERRHELKQLKEIEAVYLFRQTAKDKQLNKLLSLDEKVIRRYVNKISCYPLAIKWVIGLVARGKDINKVIDSINDASGDIAKFCFEQIFSDLDEKCKLILYSISCFDEAPTAGVLKYVVKLDDNEFEDGIEELILVSILIPEQFKNEQDEISSKFSILSLTKGFIRQQLDKHPKIKELIENKISEVQGAIIETEKAKREYRYSLNNFGATSAEEKVAAILIQTALQKYQANKYEDAVENYKSAMKIAPRFSTIYRNWAVMESFEGNTKNADSLMQKANELSPNDPQIWLLWGNIYKKATNIKETHAKYEKALSLAPEDHIILNALGQAKNRLGEYETADNLLKKALDIGMKLSSTKHEIMNRSTLIENLFSWSDYFTKDRNVTLCGQKLLEAREHANKLIALDSKDAKSKVLFCQAYFKLGIFYKKNGNINIAETYFEKLMNTKTISYKENYYIVNAILEYCQLKINNDEKKSYSVLKQILLPLKDKYFREFEKQKSALERYNFLVEIVKDSEDIVLPKQSDSDEPKKLQGVIISVYLERNCVIIKSDGVTYLGGGEKFEYGEKAINKQLIGKRVEFKKLKTPAGNRDKACNIKVI